MWVIGEHDTLSSESSHSLDCPAHAKRPAPKDTHHPSSQTSGKCTDTPKWASRAHQLHRQHTIPQPKHTQHETLPVKTSLPQQRRGLLSQRRSFDPSGHD